MLVFFLLLVFVTPIPQYLGYASSFMSATMSVLLLFIISFGVTNKFEIRKSIFNKVIMSIVLVLIHFLLANVFFEVDFMRGLLSILFILIIVLSAYLFSKLIQYLSDKDIERIVNIILILMIVVFIVSYIPAIQNTTDHQKPMFPYSEPSHFSLFIAPFLGVKLFCLSGKRRLIVMFIGILAGFLMKNFTMIIIVIFFSILVFRSKNIFILSLGAVLLYLGIDYMDVSYYTDRLNLSSTSDNLSVLVYLQGWQLAWEGLKNTYGFGIGFQQLGFVPIETEAGYIINKLIGKEVNVTDAGITAPKMIAELGILGLGMVVYYMYKFINVYMKWKGEYLGVKSFFIYSLFFSFFIALFVRGIGYYNTPLFFVLVSCFLIEQKHNNKKKI